MKTPLKLLLTAVALVLIFSGGVTFMTTTIPGVAMLGYIWGFSPTVK